DLERQQPGGFEQNILIGARCPHVGQLLFLARVDDHVTATGVLPDDHALVDVVSRLDEHGPALLQVIERKAHGLAPGHADHHAIAAAGNFSLERPVVVEVVVHDGLALGGTHEATAQADQAARGDQKLEVGVGPLPVHLAHLAASGTHQFHDGADVAVRDVDHEELARFVVHAADLLYYYRGRAHRELETLAAHRLDQYRKVEQAPARDLEGITVIGDLDTKGDVRLQFPCQSIIDVSRGQILPLSREGRVVDGEEHAQGRLADLDSRQ